METIGSRIEHAANKKGWTLAQFAVALGVSYETVRKWRLPDATAPNRKRVEKICALLEVTPEWVMFGSEAPVIDERDLVHGDPIDEASHNAMSTAFTLRSALGQIARKMRDADPTEREMVALLMRDIAIRPDEVDATLGRLFQIVGISAEQTAATGASAVSKAADPPATGPPPAPAQSSRPVTPLHGAHDGRRQASRLIGNERNRPASQPRKTSSKK